MLARRRRRSGDPQRLSSVAPKRAAGDPAPVLLDLSDEAALLVVGNRGRGGFRGPLLGSVGPYLLRHAGCPVLMARGP